jgi:hypothetical protein
MPKSGAAEDFATRPSSHSMASLGIRTGACPIGSGMVRISVVTCCRPSGVQQASRSVLDTRAAAGKQECSWRDFRWQLRGNTAAQADSGICKKGLARFPASRYAGSWKKP